MRASAMKQAAAALLGVAVLGASVYAQHRGGGGGGHAGGGHHAAPAGHAHSNPAPHHPPTFNTPPTHNPAHQAPPAHHAAHHPGNVQPLHHDGKRQHEITELKHRDARLKHEITDLKQRDAKLQQEIAGLKPTGPRQKHELAELKYRDARLKHEIAALKYRDERTQRALAELRHHRTELTRRPNQLKPNPTLQTVAKNQLPKYPTNLGLSATGTKHLQQVLTGPGSTLIQQQTWQNIANNKTLSQTQIQVLANLAGSTNSANLSKAVNVATLQSAGSQQANQLVSALTGAGLGAVALLGNSGGFGGGGGGGSFGDGVAADLFSDGSAGAVIPMEPGVEGGPSFLAGLDPNFGPLAEVAAEDAAFNVTQALADASDWQGTRFLQLANNTNEPVTVYLQYRGQTEDGAWAWLPGQPGTNQALTYQLQPGQAADVLDNDWRVNASRVRIWAVSNSREFNRFQNEDYWLVPEADEQGTHTYFAPTIQTHKIAIQ